MQGQLGDSELARGGPAELILRKLALTSGSPQSARLKALGSL